MKTLPARKGHFELESGLHTDTWLELETAFVDPQKFQPLTDALADLLQPFDPTAVCGPVAGGALVAQAVAQRLKLRFYFSELERTRTMGGLFNAIYRLPPSVRAQAAGERFAVVDDAISAGSSTRATMEDLDGLGAKTVVVGSIWMLGERGEKLFTTKSIPVVAVERGPLVTWAPSDCPLCRSAEPLIIKAPYLAS